MMLYSCTRMAGVGVNDDVCLSVWLFVYLSPFVQPAIRFTGRQRVLLEPSTASSRWRQNVCRTADLQACNNLLLWGGYRLDPL